MTPEEQEMACLAKNLTLIFTFGVIQEVSQFIRLNDKIYVNCRLYEDLDERGKQEIGYHYIEEMKVAARMLP
jgi:hypothetical protein